MNLPQKIAFVDIETTGCNFNRDKIIEIAVIRVENQKITQTFHTLINPQKYLSPEITKITGLNFSDLENAPTFYQIKKELLEILGGCVFAAHNVRFDLSFIKKEFKRENISFAPKHFCTVKLSRHLYPQHKRHSLDAIIKRFDFNCQNRHRALDDTKILWQFYQEISQKFPAEILLDAFKKAMKHPSRPIMIGQDILDGLPESPGVYIFYGQNNLPLYIGKSINIRERVLSHFSSDQNSHKELMISQQITRIETIQTTGELGALFKESALIKQLQPLYNRKLRRSRKLYIVTQKIDANGYLNAQIEILPQVEPGDLEKILGVFRSKKQAHEFLLQTGKEHRLCEKLLNIEKTNSSCFGYRLERCKGACANKELPALYNGRFIIAFSKTRISAWPFNGPIAIEEKDGISKTEYHIFNKWCYLGCIKQDAVTNFSEAQTNIDFDLDTYKIIKSFLSSQKTAKKIKILKSSEIDYLKTTEFISSPV